MRLKSIVRSKNSSQVDLVSETLLNQLIEVNFLLFYFFLFSRKRNKKRTIINNRNLDLFSENY